MNFPRTPIIITLSPQAYYATAYDSSYLNSGQPFQTSILGQGWPPLPSTDGPPISAALASRRPGPVYGVSLPGAPGNLWRSKPRQGKRESCTPPLLAVHPNAAAVGIDDALDDGQAQAQAAFHPGAFSPIEQFKQVGLVLRAEYRGPGLAPKTELRPRDRGLLRLTRLWGGEYLMAFSSRLDKARCNKRGSAWSTRGSGGNSVCRVTPLASARG